MKKIHLFFFIFIQILTSIGCSSRVDGRVDFVDYNGTILYTTYVEYGNAAVYYGPIPTRNSEYSGSYVTEYTFSNWDKNTNNINSDIIITAEYISQTYTQYERIIRDINDLVENYGEYDSAGSKEYRVFSDSNTQSKMIFSYGIDNWKTYIGLEPKLNNAFSTCVLRMYLPDKYSGSYKYNFVFAGMGNDLYKGIGYGSVSVESYSSNTILSFDSYEGNVDKSTIEELFNISFQSLLSFFANKTEYSLENLGFDESLK